MLMLMHLYTEKYLDDVLMSFVEAGVTNTLVISGENMSHKLTYDLPIFAGFRSLSSGKGYGKLLSGFATKKQVDFALEELKKSGIDLIDKNHAEIALIPVEYKYKGEEV